MKKKRLGFLFKPQIHRKLFPSWKVMVLILLHGTVAVPVYCGNPQEKITLNLQQVPIKTLFYEIQKQTGLNFIFSEEQCKQVEKLSIQVENRTVTDVLDQVLTNTGLTYEFREKNLLIIRPRKEDAQPLPQIQQWLIKGKITDGKDLPMSGVTVRLDGTYMGVVSDAGGNFMITVPVDSGILLISFVGYKTKKIPFTGNSMLTVKMEEEVSALDEVQVVAYGSQSKRETVGAISSVKAESLRDGAVSDLVTKLQGQLPGVNIVATSGSPGAQAAITVRGHNSLSIENGRIGSDPLWVVDGVPLYSTPDQYSGITPLSTLPPEDIGRIDVLKDASAAALYGSRAANGVVIITTKSGRFGEKFRASVNFTQSFSFRSPLPEITAGNAERRFRMEAFRNYTEAVSDYETNSQHYIGSYEESEETGLHKDYFWNRGQGRTIAHLQDSLNRFYNNDYALYKYFFRTRKVSNFNVSFSGGNPGVAYYIGVGYYTEKGALIRTGFNRASLTGNFSFRPHPKVNGRLTFGLTWTGYERASKDQNEFTGTWVNGMRVPVIPDLIMNTSTLTVPEGSEAFDYVFRSYDYLKEDNDMLRVRTNTDFDYEITEGLKLQTRFAFDWLAPHRNTFMPSDFDEYGQNFSTGSDSRNLSALNEDIVSYDRWFDGRHHVRLMAGISFQLDQYNMRGGYRRDTGNDKIYWAEYTDNAVDISTNRQLVGYKSDKTKSALVSTFARIGYNYRNRYMAEATFRRDGSSRFGSNTRWGTFPSVAVGYSFTEEPFLQGIREILSYGKIRASWGRTGKEFSEPYRATGAYGLTGQTFLGKPTMQTMELPNPDLSWEETDQYDLGIDLNFFNYRLGVTLDYYYRYTDKLLYPVFLPGNYTGFDTQWQNAFAISNQGVELSLDADIIRREDLSLKISVNIARNWNRLEKSFMNRTVYNPVSTYNVSVAGKEMNRIFVLDDRGGFYRDRDEVPYFYIDGQKTWLGLYKQYYREGDRKILDADRNGVISSIQGVQDDRRDAGSPLPKASGGINIKLSYRNFDLNMNMPFTIGRHILYAGEKTSLATNQGSNGPVFADLGKYVFYKDGLAGYNMPRNEMVGELANYEAGLWSNVYNVHSLKMRLLSVGYTFPRRMVKFGTIRLFVSGENLFILKNFPGSDPDIADPVTGVYSFNTYPVSRTVNFGININF